MAKKGKGFFGSIGSFLGSIPAVGKVKNAAKSVKKKIKNTKKKLKKAIKKAKKKLKKKLKKKIGKVFTKARKLKNNLSKSKMVKKFKRAAKKVVLAAKKVASKAKSTAKAATKAVTQTAKKVATAVKSIDVKQAISTAVDFIPIVGNVKAAYEVVVGKDPFTGKKLAPWERAVSAAAIVGGPAVKGAKHAAKIGGSAVSGIAKAGKKGVPTKAPAAPPKATGMKTKTAPLPKSNPTGGMKIATAKPPKSNPTTGTKVASKNPGPKGTVLPKVAYKEPPKKPDPKNTVQTKVAYKEQPNSNSQVNSLPKAVGMETTPNSIEKIQIPKAASKNEAQVISFPKAVGESGSTPRPTPKSNSMPSAKSGETKGTGNPKLPSDEELFNAVTEWSNMQKKLAPSKRKKDSFNTSTVIYDSRTGEYYYGMNKGVQLSGDSKNPILFGDKGKGGLLPENSLNKYALGNCAEVDGVNQALNRGANTSDLYLYTIETTPSAFGKAKEACKNCTFTFKGNVADVLTGWYKGGD
ncbi:pre-toxin TG domain-containing protein [Lysinibacillus parviboronicapiens]|uniref:pre-toxin TG domain-containing protein n=1 Tax=Lysinibacillus parviboronicapiens TaxID=436516 RepID=UPI000D3C6D22|nr:pre-toxin TG domain-containing protein [Lysinibacillus parviboronicapiens]